jgi:3-isopropylmalate dehydrogenase
MKAHLAVLPGDGIGPEVVAEGAKVLRAVAQQFDHTIVFEHGLIGGAAIDAAGVALPEETLDLCRRCSAVLFGAVGGPRWSDPWAAVRPEQGLLQLRKQLGLFANLRPVCVRPALREASPIRPELLQGVDLLVVRELTGGIYFGQRQEASPSADVAHDTMAYSAPEIRRVAHVAFRLAMKRRRRLALVDKANVLATSRLWRQTVGELAKQYPYVSYETILVDAMAMHLIRRPADFDVILTANMFGDILSDEASVLVGSLGMLPSASLGEGRRGLYEPIHGSAPDIAGQGIANPLGAILSAALLLRHSLGLGCEADAVEAAVGMVLEQGHRTADLAFSGGRTVGTAEMGDLVVEALRGSGSSSDSALAG